MNEKPTHLDLFSGIGGFALAAGWAGFETVGFCEIEPYCQAVLKKHWPQVPIHTDIRELRGGGKESIYLQGVFLVSHSVLPGSEEARMMTVTSGKKCLGLSKKQTQLGLLEKMLLESSIWDCKKRLLIWKPLVMKSGYLIYQLYPSMPSIRESEFGLLPTPTASDKTYGRKPTTKRKNNVQKTSLRDVLSEKFSKNGKGGSPHPTFVEAMMGYPIGHTELKDWATPSSRKSHTKSSKA